MLTIERYEKLRNLMLQYQTDLANLVDSEVDDILPKSVDDNLYTKMVLIEKDNVRNSLNIVERQIDFLTKIREMRKKAE